MSLTLGLTGMDPDTEVALKAAFAEANERRGNPWRLASEADAAHVVVDMDTMYGPMSWLRLHAAGKNVIGLTSAPRTQADFRLGRPFDSHQVGVLLEQIATGEHAGLPSGGDTGAQATGPGSVSAIEATSAAPEVDDAPPAPGTDASAKPASASVLETTPEDGQARAIPSGMTPAPAPQDQLPEEVVAAVAEAAEPPVADPTPVLPAVPARDPVFSDWLVPGALASRVRYRRKDGPALLIDPTAEAWHGPTALKSIAPSIGGMVDRDAFEAMDDTQWASESAAAGAAQPLSRLAWLSGLMAGQGALLPEHDAQGRYALTKWPQTEREYPRHFRIATAMMKGPATVAEIAEASDMTAADVADFINASLVTGFAEFVPEPPPEPAEPAKPSGLFGRLRNR